ncbi:MAG: hypothetical protein BWK73_04670 [Thiothrix lacustris]|uniref:Phage tail protein n=1 Tax=Thiothrix lacustris TaxID=525917 RepID=A0A1Y1QXQ2_9GAMM|nr:MAG: hypothetical protein BWK73_04670 [Thiothrix lacustris]
MEIENKTNATIDGELVSAVSESAQVHRNGDVITIPLDVPLQRGDKVLDQVVINRPSGSGFLRGGVSLGKLLEGDFDTLALVVPRISNILKNEWDKLDLADINAISTEIVLLFGKKKLRASL